jgi:hypothetical protein
MWMDVKHIWCFLQQKSGKNVQMSNVFFYLWVDDCWQAVLLWGLLLYDDIQKHFWHSFKQISVGWPIDRETSSLTVDPSWFVKTNDPWNLGITKFPQGVPSRIPHKQIPDMMNHIQATQNGDRRKQGIPFSKEKMRNQVSMTLHWLNHVKSQFSMVKSSFSNMFLTIIH